MVVKVNKLNWLTAFVFFRCAPFGLLLVSPAMGQSVPHADFRDLLKAAERGDIAAQIHLGQKYERGEGVRQDYAEAIRWYRKSADQGFPLAQELVGETEDLVDNFAEAAKWYLRAADQGDSIAQGKLGLAYELGQGVLQDFAEAAKWYQKAADQGEAHAQVALGSLYYWGQGVPQDFAEAAKWYRKAADQGYKNAQGALGIMYEEGRGVPQDYVQAHMWFNLSGARGSATGIEGRGRVAQKMTPVQIAEAQRLAREWKPTKAK